MIFGYSTNAFVKFSLQQSLAKIARLGFKGVEIMGDRPHLYPPDFDQAARAELKSALRQHNLKLTNINSFTLFAVGDTYLPSWIEPEADRRAIRVQHTLDSLEIAAELGCANISIPPGGPLENMSRPRAVRLFHQELAKVVPRAEALGVKLLVEPEQGLLIENSIQFAQFIKEESSPLVGLNFDIGHFFCVGEDPVRAFEALFEYVGHMHIEDIGADRSHNHLIAGQGAINYPAIFASMARLGYQGDLSLELYPYVDTPEKAGEASLRHLKPLLEQAGWTI